MSERSTSHFLTLLRHGESVANAEGIWQGHYDSPLTALGKTQAASLGERWLNEKVDFDYVVASPLARAFETAEIVAKKLNIEIEQDQIWMERDSGIFSGKKRSEIPAAALARDFYEPIGETGESDHDLFVRAEKAIQGLMVRKPGSYLIVSHGGILNRVMSVLLGLRPQSVAGVRFAFGNTAFAKLEYRPGEKLWLLKCLNDQAHLSGNDKLPIWQG